MKNSILFLMLFTLYSCQEITEKKIESVKLKKSEIKNQQSKKNFEGLFKLTIKVEENYVNIIPPQHSKFELPDNNDKKEPYKFGDFNADGKQDVLVYFGACGTGGCMYGLFLNQYDHYYKLAFMDYLKNAEFRIGKNGLWTIESSEELEPYNPSKIQMTIFKFDQKKQQYMIDTTYIDSY